MFLKKEAKKDTLILAQNKLFLYLFVSTLLSIT